MDKLMTLEVLSSIKGATSSKSIEKLFQIVKNADTNLAAIDKEASIETISLEDLRADVIVESSELEKEIIKENFPLSKNSYLVVQKVIED